MSRTEPLAVIVSDLLAFFRLNEVIEKNCGVDAVTQRNALAGNFVSSVDADALRGLHEKWGCHGLSVRLEKRDE